MDLDDYLVPLVIAKKEACLPKIHYTLDRYAGVAFFVDQHSTLATCAHVVDMAQPGEALLGMDMKNGGYYELLDIKRHGKYDFATAKFPFKPKYKRFILGPIDTLPGQDVGAFGFTSNRKQDGNIIIDARYFKGHIVRFSHEPAKPDARSLLEVSFASHKGFSGTPLIAVGTEAIIGMLFSNLESSIEVYSNLEVEDGGGRYKEVVHRIVELGLAHTAADIRKFIEEMT